MHLTTRMIGSEREREIVQSTIITIALSTYQSWLGPFPAIGIYSIETEKRRREDEKKSQVNCNRFAWVYN